MQQKTSVVVCLAVTVFQWVTDIKKAEIFRWRLTFLATLLTFCTHFTTLMSALTLYSRKARQWSLGFFMVQFLMAITHCKLQVYEALVCVFVCITVCLYVWLTDTSAVLTDLYACHGSSLRICCRKRMSCRKRTPWWKQPLCYRCVCECVWWCY